MAYFYLQWNREVQQALLARSTPQSSSVMLLVEEGIFAWGVVNIKAPFGQPIQPLPNARIQEKGNIAPPRDTCC